MKLTDVKSNEDILNFIEGCLNDFESGESSKKETIIAMVDLFQHMAKVLVSRVPLTKDKI